MTPSSALDVLVESGGARLVDAVQNEDLSEDLKPMMLAELAAILNAASERDVRCLLIETTERLWSTRKGCHRAERSNRDKFPVAEFFRILCCLLVFVFSFVGDWVGNFGESLSAYFKSPVLYSLAILSEALQLYIGGGKFSCWCLIFYLPSIAFVFWLYAVKSEWYNYLVLVILVFRGYRRIDEACYLLMMVGKSFALVCCGCLTGCKVVWKFVSGTTYVRLSSHGNDRVLTDIDAGTHGYTHGAQDDVSSDDVLDESANVLNKNANEIAIDIQSSTDEDCSSVSVDDDNDDNASCDVELDSGMLKITCQTEHNFSNIGAQGECTLDLHFDHSNSAFRPVQASDDQHASTGESIAEHDAISDPCGEPCSRVQDLCQSTAFDKPESPIPLRRRPRILWSPSSAKLENPPSA
eukprot:GILJ01001371.1.p1 GENE.GILJ01001371.1~~GILJ01001371.1.p1  ORF type:complete len:410 (-),score=13.38 GILJ01001371.1:1054-2283(-)